MGWFKKAKSKDSFEDLELLKFGGIQHAVLASKTIKDNWHQTSGEDLYTEPTDDWHVRIEMLAFLLHMSNRYAFDIGGLSARDALQDAITVDVTEKMLRASWDDSQVQDDKRDDIFKRWQIDILNWVGDAEEDYCSCKALAVEPLPTNNEAGILGKLTLRVSQVVREESSIELRLLIGMIAADTLVNSKLKQQVEKACKALR